MAHSVARERARMSKKEALFGRLQGVYSDLATLDSAHSQTKYTCQRSGNCCQVGLELHMMECEHIARHITAEMQADPSKRDKWMSGLYRALNDPDWKTRTGIGSEFCAFFDGGCTVYPARPGICRMYGSILEVDEWCPRVKMASGMPFVYSSPQVDGLVRELYEVLDAYGRMYPRLDYQIYMAAGVLKWMLPPEEIKALKAATSPRFWKTTTGYRTQFKPSRKMEGQPPETRQHPALRMITRPRV